MPGRTALVALAASLACFVAAHAPEPAAATTICVPSFSSACPNSGGSVAEADVEKAMSLNAKDGIPDRIVVAAGTFTETGSYEPEMSSNPGSFEPTGFDALTIEGAGTEATVLTSGVPGNIFVVNFSSNNARSIAVRELTIRVPANFEDGLGTAVQSSGDTFENVDIVSLNVGSDGIRTNGQGNLFRGGELRGESGGEIANALNAGTTGSTLLVEDATISGAAWGLISTGKAAHLTARRVLIAEARGYGAGAMSGRTTIENSIITLDDGIGLYASASAEDSRVVADHLTIVNSGGSGPAVEGKKFSPSVGDAALEVSNSILRGFGSGYKVETPIGPGVGTVSVGVRYSNAATGGTNVNGTVDFSTGNIDADPQLLADLSLPPSSPSVDAGDPAAGGLASDFLGAPRPADGDGDGVVVRDQGAFEYQPPASPAPAAPPDTTAPQTKIMKGPGGKLAKGVARFRFSSSEAGSSFVCKLDRRKSRGCRSPKRYSHLRPGRHTFRVWAIDAAGNRDRTPAKRRFRVPAA